MEFRIRYYRLYENLKLIFKTQSNIQYISKFLFQMSCQKAKLLCLDCIMQYDHHLLGIEREKENEKEGKKREALNAQTSLLAIKFITYVSILRELSRLLARRKYYVELCTILSSVLKTFKCKKTHYSVITSIKTASADLVPSMEGNHCPLPMYNVYTMPTIQLKQNVVSIS